MLKCLNDVFFYFSFAFFFLIFCLYSHNLLSLRVKVYYSELMRNLLLLLAVLIVSCTAKPHSSADATLPTSEQRADSIARAQADSLRQLEVTPIHPDTSFASIEALKYSITVFDTVTSGRVSGYKDLYRGAPGILTFRGSLDRTAPFIGHVQGTPDTLITEWTFRTKADNRPTNHGRWGGGTGWTGQPLYIVWPDSLLEAFRRDTTCHATLPGASEIIFASLNSNVYFLDYESGQPSRDPIYVNNPIKGTPMLDPLLNGRLYVGHGVLADNEYGWGQVTIDLFRHEVVHFMNKDRRSWRGWDGNDASPLRIGNFVFHVSENGSIYKWEDTPEGRRLHSTLRYRVRGSAPGFEASMCVWGNYGYCNDNHGNVLCINLDNLQPVWHYDNHDDCDCTPVLLHEADGTYIYTGSEVDIHPNDSVSRYVKLNALTGERVWELTAPSYRYVKDEKHFDGGYYASSLPGRANCSHLIFDNRVINEHTASGQRQNGVFVAIDRRTGEEVYATRLKCYAWSSPVGFVNERGEFYVLTFDTVGNCYLIDGLTGRVLHTARVGGNFESSPIVVDNHVVVGSRNGTIYKFRVE